MQLAMRCDDERLPIDWRGGFRRLADGLKKKRANFADVRAGVALTNCNGRVR